MKKEDKVISLETAKKFYELKLDGHSDLWWNDQGLGHWSIGNYRPGMSTYRAYDVAELGEMLPECILSQKCMASKEKDKDKYTWCCFEKMSSRGMIGLCLYADTEAEVRGKMLICLIENGHVKAEGL